VHFVGFGFRDWSRQVFVGHNPRRLSMSDTVSNCIDVCGDTVSWPNTFPARCRYEPFSVVLHLNAPNCKPTIGEAIDNWWRRKSTQYLCSRRKSKAGADRNLHSLRVNAINSCQQQTLLSDTSRKAPIDLTICGQIPLHLLLLISVKLNPSDESWSVSETHIIRFFAYFTIVTSALRRVPLYFK
jgi:hypothetical protein